MASGDVWLGGGWGWDGKVVEEVHLMNEGENFGARPKSKGAGN